MYTCDVVRALVHFTITGLVHGARSPCAAIKVSVADVQHAGTTVLSIDVSVVANIAR